MIPNLGPLIEREVDFVANQIGAAFIGVLRQSNVECPQITELMFFFFFVD